MKKLIVIALVFMAGATLTTQAKDKKKKPMSTSQQTAVKLVSASDSLSYLAGMTATDGLVPYLQQSFQVDTTNMADFLKGFLEAQSRVGDPAFKAYAAGMQIAEMVNSRILPNMKQAFEGSNDSIQRVMFLNGFTAALQNDTTFFAQSEASRLYRKRMDNVVESHQRLDRSTHNDACWQ